MKIFARQFLSGILSLAIGISPIANADSSRPKLSPETAFASEQAEYSRSADQTKYGTSSNELAKKVEQYRFLKGTLKGTGHAIASDVLQMSIIMAATAVAQLLKTQYEQKRLLNGYQPKFEEVKKDAVQAAEHFLCGSDPKSATIAGEIACSGEFWTGVAGGFALKAGTSAVSTIFALLMKKSPTRTALTQIVGTFATSFIMIAGFTASGHLWTQAVHVLNDKDKEERAHNLFGRLVTEMARGNWDNYVKTEDGKLAEEVWNNMKNILLFDQNLRAGWIYNAWRFGLARGELILNMSIMMGALAAGGIYGSALGATAGASTTAALGLSGTAATVSGAAVGVTISFLVATAIGAFVAGAVIYAPDWEVGDKITHTIQDMRGFLAGVQHSNTRNQLSITSDAFDTNRFNTAQTHKYRKRFENRARMLFTELRTQRLNSVNVSIEKYFELREKLEKAEATIAMAKEVIQNTEFRAQLVVKDGDEYLSYDEAWAKNCKGLSRDHWCDVPAAYQLQKIDEAKKLIAQARQLLPQIAQKMIDIYDEDSRALQDILDKENLQIPADVAIAMKDETDNLGLIAEKMILYLGAIHQSIGQRYSVNFTTESEADLAKAYGKQFITKFYIPGMDEDAFLGNLKRVSRR